MKGSRTEKGGGGKGCPLQAANVVELATLMVIKGPPWRGREVKGRVSVSIMYDKRLGWVQGAGAEGGLGMEGWLGERGGMLVPSLGDMKQRGYCCAGRGVGGGGLARRNERR